MESTLNNFVEIGAVILALIFILGFLNFYVTSLPKKLKSILSFLIVISAAIWLLRDLGLLHSVINSISNRIKTVLK